MNDDAEQKQTCQQQTKSVKFSTRKRLVIRSVVTFATGYHVRKVAHLSFLILVLTVKPLGDYLAKQILDDTVAAKAAAGDDIV